MKTITRENISYLGEDLNGKIIAHKDLKKLKVIIGQNVIKIEKVTTLYNSLNQPFEFKQIILKA